jgi:hypothetical protein
MAVKSKPTMFQIREAITKNVCDSGDEQYKVVKDMRANSKLEGDSQLKMVLFVGLATSHGYTQSDIMLLAHLQKKEYTYKLRKFRRKMAGIDARFKIKIKLINNYLNYRYGFQIKEVARA